MFQTSRWLEFMIHNDFKLDTAAASIDYNTDAPLPHALLDELELVWKNCREWNNDDIEDEMIARFRRWRKGLPLQEREETLGSTVSIEPTTSNISEGTNLLPQDRGTPAPFVSPDFIAAIADTDPEVVTADKRITRQDKSRS